MKYMIYETIGSDDVRNDPSKIKIIDYFWLYTISEVSDDFPHEWLKGEEITRQVAHSYYFPGAVENEISIMRSTTNPEDMMEPTSLGDNDYEKVNYALTVDDRLNAVNLMKATMRLHATHYCKNEAERNRLIAALNTLSQLPETQMFMATYFDWDCAYTYNKTKTKEFDFSVTEPWAATPIE